MSDGPMGVHDYGLTTAYPAGIALAASWDTELAERFGTSMGKDARARGVHFILAPGMNIYRAPMNGRNFEYFRRRSFPRLENGRIRDSRESRDNASSRPQNTLPEITRSSHA